MQTYILHVGSFGIQLNINLYLDLMATVISRFISALHMNGKWGLICYLFGGMSGSEQGCNTWQCVIGCCHGNSCEKRKITVRECQNSVEILRGVNALPLSRCFAFTGGFFFTEF